jgi:hypothetical protein
MTRRNVGLNGNELAAAIGITPNRRLDWARQGLLRRTRPYGSLDAVDLACLGALVSKVGPKSAKRCWPMIRQALRDRLPNRRARMWAIIDERPAAVQLATTPSAVTAAASNAQGFVTVLAVHEIAEKALDAYRQAMPTSEDELGRPVHDIASKRSKSKSA